MSGTSEFIDDEKYIADVNGNVTTNVGVVDEITHRAFPTTVKIEAEQLSIGLYSYHFYQECYFLQFGFCR